MELGWLRSREGLALLGAAVVDDVLAIAVLSAFVAFALEGGSSWLSIAWIVLRMVLFLAGAFALGMWLLPRAARWVEDHDLPVAEPVVSLIVVSILVFAWAAEVVGGVAAITGAFMAGVALSTSPLKGKIARGIHTLAYAFFVPIFLVGIGLSADLQALFTGDGLWLAVAVSAVAVVSKFVGAGLGAKIGSLAVGRRPALAGAHDQQPGGSVLAFNSIGHRGLRHAGRLCLGDLGECPAAGSDSRLTGERRHRLAQ